MTKKSSYKDELIDEIKTLAQSNGLNTVFTTFLEITATSIGAQMDPQNAEEREQRYQEIASKMTPETLSSYARMFALLTLATREHAEDPCDILGDVYHELRLNNEWNGQFFTPDHICRLMAQIVNIDVPEDVMETGTIPATGYTVSFDANGGTGTMADVTGVSGTYTLPENGFTAPEGKQFKAWSVGGNEKAARDKITVTANITATAVWENIPAGHTCDIKPVANVNPSCTEGGKEAYYKCEGCGKFFEDVLGTKEITDLAAWGNIPKNGHTASDWKSDDADHWKECTGVGCGVIIEGSKEAHTASDWITDTAATATTAGTKHKECTTCGYVMETGTIPATGSVTAPKIIKGDGAKVTHGEKTALSFRSDADFSDFIRVEIDGKTLDAKNYTVKEGSTIVTLNSDYVSTLSVGTHTIGVVSNNATATATFTVEAGQTTGDKDNPNTGAQDDVPQTGDNSMMALWIAVLFVSGFGVVATAVYGKKRKSVK